MIKNLWIRMVAIVLLALLPASILQYFQQKQSLAKMMQIVKSIEVENVLEESANELRFAAEKIPESEERFKSSFLKIVKIKQELEDIYKID